jgi:hypothetical protein
MALNGEMTSMRATIATIAALLAVALVSPTTGFAQKAKKGTGEIKSFNACVKLAKERGFNGMDRVDADSGITDTNARRFVMNCMQGRQS